MFELLQTLLSLSGDIKEIKAQVHVIKQSRAEKLKLNWVDSVQAMQILNISKRTLHQWRSRGVLPYSRIQGKLYYKVSDLENLLEKAYSPAVK